MTSAFEDFLLVLFSATVLSGAARWLPWPTPITLVLGGLGLSQTPGFPQVFLDPEIFFVCFLPPLLFADGWLMPLREFMRVRRSVLLLAIGLVAFTTVLVGVTLHALAPTLPLAMCFALGALVSPTDAVAVSAITQRLRVPARFVTILNGESLMNDATGLVAFKFALAALAAGGTFSLGAMTGQFLLLAVGGFIFGLVAGWLVGLARDLLRRWHGVDAAVETTVSLLTPYAAYLAADALGVSPILSVVAAGLYSGWRDPVRMDVETRRTAWAVWSLALFWLNGMAFVLLGLQAPTVIGDVMGDYGFGRWAALTAAVSGVAIVARIAWFFPGAYLPRMLFRRIRETEPVPSWRAVLAGGWAGMRGAVTLAAALSIPLTLPEGAPMPGRNVVIALAFGVILVTLLLQGTTLAWVIRILGVQAGDTPAEEERLARTTAVEAGLNALRALDADTPDESDRAALGAVVAEYEQRLAELASEGETQQESRRRRTSGRRYRLAALAAERSAIDRLWHDQAIDDGVHRPLQLLLDHEEAMLRGAAGESAEIGA
jgi:CPA1 family monovalent cation:H+ antiporter